MYNFPFKSTGVIKYYENWALLDCCTGIVDYYKKIIETETKCFIHRPKYYSHISVVRGDLPDKFKHYKSDEIVDFKYDFPENNGEYWWLDVESDRLEEIRLEMGLSKTPTFGFHLTIGKIDIPK